MGTLTGLVTELLIPGIFAIFGIGLVLVEYFGLDVGRLLKENNTFVVTAFLVGAYVVGIVVRHQTLLKAPSFYYRRRIIKKWQHVFHPVRARIGCDLLELSKTNEEATNLTEEQSREFVGIVRDYVLAHKSKELCDYLMYEWNLARLSRNCHTPMMVVLFGLGLGGIRRLTIGDTSASTYYFVACGMALLILLLLNRSYRSRLNWHLDILMRTAAMEWCWFEKNKNENTKTCK